MAGMGATEPAPTASTKWDGEPAAPPKCQSEQPSWQEIVGVMAGMTSEVDALASALHTRKPRVIGRACRKHQEKMRMQPIGQARPHPTQQAMRRGVNQGEMKCVAIEKAVRPVPRRCCRIKCAHRQRKWCKRSKLQAYASTDR